MARRIRPPDLWVGEDAMLLAVRPWDWDLTPWSRGEPAVPSLVSGVNGVKPFTSINLDEIEKVLVDDAFADKAIACELLYGLADDVQLPRGSFLCAPHSGALRFYAEARTRLDAGVKAGWAKEHMSLPYWPIRCDPYSVVDETARNKGIPKFRLSNDHSWPPKRGGGNDADIDRRHVDSRISLNASMNRDNWPATKLMRVQELASSGAILHQSGAKVKLCAVDGVAYYKQVGRQLLYEATRVVTAQLLGPRSVMAQ